MQIAPLRTGHCSSPSGTHLIQVEKPKFHCHRKYSFNCTAWYTPLQDCVWPMALHRSQKPPSGLLRSERSVQYLVLSLFVVSQIPGEGGAQALSGLCQSLSFCIGKDCVGKREGGWHSKRHMALVLYWPPVPTAAGQQAGRLSLQRHIPL